MIYVKTFYRDNVIHLYFQLKTFLLRYKVFRPDIKRKIETSHQNEKKMSCQAAIKKEKNNL